MLLNKRRPRICALLLLACAPLAAQTGKQPSFADVAPILSKCVQCHNAANRTANLDLANRPRHAEGRPTRSGCGSRRFRREPPVQACGRARTASHAARR
jgi:hypothetical protein